MFTVPTLIQHIAGSPSQNNQRRERNKGIQIGNGEVKLSLFADDIIHYIENPKDSTKNLLEIINKYSKFAGYKINVQKSSAFVCNNETSEKKFLKNNSLCNGNKNNKIPRTKECIH